jgi:hypothetical protein
MQTGARGARPFRFGAEKTYSRRRRAHASLSGRTRPKQRSKLRLQAPGPARHERRAGPGCEDEADAERKRPWRRRFGTAARASGAGAAGIATSAAHARDRVTWPFVPASHEEIFTAPGCFPMESSQPPGEGSPRPRPGQDLSFDATPGRGSRRANDPPDRRGRGDGRFRHHPWNVRVYARVILRATHLSKGGQG